MDGKFNPYRAGQPLSGNGNPNTGVWQRTWEDGGPGRPSHVVNTTSGGVSDWSGKQWKPEAPGLGKRLANSLPSVDSLTSALLYGHITASDEEPTDEEPTDETPTDAFGKVPSYGKVPSTDAGNQRPMEEKDVPSHESIQQGFEASNKFYTEASQDAKSVEVPQGKGIDSQEERNRRKKEWNNTNVQ